MEFGMYEKIIKQLAEFPKGIKRIVFSGLGEPLMNPRLPEMVKIAVDAQIADRVEVITNGVLLTPEMSDKLIEAGITNINVSIQGINTEQYDNTVLTSIDADRVIIDCISKIVSIMFTSNQAIVEDPTYNVYAEYEED
jgi:MoaA/NifB/PqqE/SkfB family radical SAM enzyme